MFVTIGDVSLNPAHIVSIEDDGNDLYVFTLASSARMIESKPYYLIPAGAKATAFRAWLAGQTQDLLPKTAEERAWVSYRAHGGTRDRFAWRQALGAALNISFVTLAESHWWHDCDHQALVNTIETELIAQEQAG